jgi:hypothetical protein
MALASSMMHDAIMPTQQLPTQVLSLTAGTTLAPHALTAKARIAARMPIWTARAEALKAAAAASGTSAAGGGGFIVAVLVKQTMQEGLSPEAAAAQVAMRAQLHASGLMQAQVRRGWSICIANARVYISLRPFLTYCPIPTSPPSPAPYTAALPR